MYIEVIPLATLRRNRLTYKCGGWSVNRHTSQNSAFHTFDHWNYPMAPPVHSNTYFLVHQTCPKMYHCWHSEIILFWQNRLLVLAKSYTSIGEIIFRYWWNCLPVLAKLSTCICEIIHRYWQYCILVLGKGQLVSLAYNFINNGRQFYQIGRWFCQYR